MSEVFPESPPSPPPAPCGCLSEFEHGPQCGARPPATATPGRAAYEARLDELLKPVKDEVDRLRGELADSVYEPGSADIGPGETIIAEFPVAAAPELAAAMAETRTVLDGYARLCGHFGPAAQSGMHARITFTQLARHRDLAGLPPLPRPARDDRDAWTELGERAEQMEAERDEARGQLAACRAELAEIRRIAYMGGQAPAFVRSELLAYLEANGGQHG